MSWFLFSALALTLMSLVFAWQNSSPVAVNLFWAWKFEASLALLLLLTFGLGLSVGIMFSILQFSGGV
ncbi:lipopolysaccharide assembly protein LapA domain-containing protein [Synechococcus sp. PCC 7336]|uniref:lipopolysaccharide assembly protein LapA domain-containing protein n=1 Tax=Synechococcus sp. PCC 7336 TaxID=195250 RepID=UPI0012EA50E5